MEENLKNKLGLTFFILIILFLSIGGYFFMQYELKDKNTNNNNKKNSVVNYKVDKDKDYIYFKNEETISERAEIFFRDVVINLNTQDNLNETLAKEVSKYKNNIEYISKKEGLNEDLIVYNNDDLYALTYRDYENYTYDKYVSLVIKDFNYSCFDNSTFIGTKSYIFDTSDGHLLSEDEILKMYNTNMDNIKNMIKSSLEKKQTTLENGLELFKIDDTINNLEQYSLYINDYGQLYIMYLAKTNEVDYNEVMEVS